MHYICFLHHPCASHLPYYTSSLSTLCIIFVSYTIPVHHIYPTILVPFQPCAQLLLCSIVPVNYIDPLTPIILFLYAPNLTLLHPFLYIPMHPIKPSYTNSFTSLCTQLNPLTPIPLPPFAPIKPSYANYSLPLSPN